MTVVHPLSELGDFQLVALMRQRSLDGWLFVDLAREFGVHPTTVGRICRGVWR